MNPAPGDVWHEFLVYFGAELRQLRVSKKVRGAEPAAPSLAATWTTNTPVRFARRFSVS
jgi:hypothetical protein